MPERRPRPIDLNATPKRKAPSGPRKNRPANSPRNPRIPRSPRKDPGNSTVLYWIGGALAVLLICLIVLYAEFPQIEAWFSKRENSPQTQNLASAPAPEIAPQEAPHSAPATPPTPSLTADERQAQLKKKADAETQKLLEHPVPKPVTAVPSPTSTSPTAPNLVPPVETPATPIPVAPPLAKPISPLAPKGPPMRAEPVDPNKLDTERIAAYQVALERLHFSCGFIDGDQGMRTQRMLRAYQSSQGLPQTGILDPATRTAIGEPGEPFLSYVVTADDLASIMPKPATWREKSKATRLGYNDIWELLAEKFHCARAYLKGLNRDVKTITAGTEVIGPKVFPAAPIPHAASLRISLSETSIEAFDANGKVIGFFPCSIARDKNKRPNGVLTVKTVDPNPDYTFDPALFADAARAEGLTKKLRIPPGPRNPVGTAWVGLSLPGYGIHGTPEPENISRTQSHGCFRLANWNAEKVLKMVRIGTPIDVEP